MRDGLDKLKGLIPTDVFELRTEANLSVVMPWFFKSLKVAGDLAEFGCFRGTMSIKMAYALKALGETDKTVYAFDTFVGFEVADPSGGALGVGAYSDNDSAYEKLEQLSRSIPVAPVKGDATVTCRQLTRPLSFVWLDLDFAMFLGPTLDGIWPMLKPDTIIGVDDVGRPETPSVEPWMNEVTSSGRLVELERYPGDFIRFYRANKS